ncbi:imidazole glycerol phosphate synthase subunit HisH [Candidatus Gottesmanbacteria bacterium]|nr:imidazole glycerol phosphate synthase subunit HisH [Candidatus Gottesmanbacteria bacterium]
MIGLIDYGIGNIGSVANALTKLEIAYEISGDPVVLSNSRALILPGVGAAGAGMKNLKERKLDAVIKKIIENGVPFLGICLGMQLLFEWSDEDNTNCLGILKGKVVKFKKEKNIPQIGWNEMKISNMKDQRSKIVDGIADNSNFYFVHSYYCIPEDDSVVVGETEYGETFASLIVQKNIVATQFHPEKSGKTGLTLLQNFMKGTQ